LYLDVYRNGERRYTFLHLYLLPETSRENRVANQSTMQMARAVEAKLRVEFQNGDYGFLSYERTGADFFEFLDERERSLRRNNPQPSHVAGLLKQKMMKYAGRKTLPFSMIDRKFIVGFLSFLRTREGMGKSGMSAESDGVLKESTIKRYCAVLNATLNKAVRDEVIPDNPMSRIASEYRPKPEPAEKSYLTEDELRKMYATHTKIKGKTREMFLFGCATGLRYSDICTLQWKHIAESEDGMLELRKKQMKTGVVVSFPLSKSAIELLPQRGTDDEYVFTDPSSPRPNNKAIANWARKAGIKKHISFHTSRHTFATLALSCGIDLYTVSKMLGHTSITQTQVYAKLVDDAKRKAINLLPTFGNY